MLGRKLYFNQGENYSALHWNSWGEPKKIAGAVQTHPGDGFHDLHCFKCITLTQHSLVLEAVSPPRTQVQF